MKKYFSFESQYISICKIIWDWTTFFTSKLFMNDNMFAVLEIIFQSLPFNELFAYLKLKRILTQRLKQRRVLTKLWNEIHNKSTNKQSPHIPCSRAFFFQKKCFCREGKIVIKRTKLNQNFESLCWFDEHRHIILEYSITIPENYVQFFYSPDMY